MLRILGKRTKLCDGVTRRELMRVGGLSLFGGMTLPQLLAASAAQQPSRPAGIRQVGDSVQPARWPQPHGHVRHEAVGSGRSPRRVSSDRHFAVRTAGLRALAAHGAANAQGDADSHRHAQLQCTQSAGDDDRFCQRCEQSIVAGTDRSARHWRDLPIPEDGFARHAGRRLLAVLSRVGRTQFVSGNSPAGPLRWVFWETDTIRSSANALRHSIANRKSFITTPFVQWARPVFRPSGNCRR